MDIIKKIDHLFELFNKNEQYMINERRFHGPGLPRYFRVVFDFEYAIDRGVGQQLKDKFLPGLVGISDDASIIFPWLGAGRDAILIMDGQQIGNDNDITRIKYDDPEYMFANECRALGRIFSQQRKDGIMQRYLEYFFRVAVEKKLIDKYEIGSTVPYARLADYGEVHNYHINNTKQFVKWFIDAIDILQQHDSKSSFRNYADEYKYLDVFKLLHEPKMKDIVRRSFELLSEAYSDEGEWMVNGKGLKIPKKSFLYILIPKIPQAVLDDFIAGRETIETEMIHRWSLQKYTKIKNEVDKYRLQDEYRIKYIDSQNWDRVKNLHYQKIDDRNLAKSIQ